MDSGGRRHAKLGPLLSNLSRPCRHFACSTSPPSMISSNFHPCRSSHSLLACASWRSNSAPDGPEMLGLSSPPLIGGRNDNEHLELYTHTGYTMFPDLRDVLSAHGSHLRSLVVKVSIKDVGVLGYCTRLERFECQSLPPDSLVAAIPRSIRALAVTNPNTRESSFSSLAYLTQQLDTFPALRIFTWVGSTEHSGFAALRDRCTELGLEVRTRAIDSLSDDDVQFELRRRLLQN
ncbi:hypothetical protein MSAN_01217900 [Mycena sanguinolenta]|uniref:Uncharacterized protein n=1 Tax=Mycena sanguinolenta TaxID=230812 RepID=A0A8H6YHH1_9AGAR|nr:hypothetical protein MSAN_01217900 [Mycena sanguinolenta]